MGECRNRSIILDLGTRWSRVVSFTLRPLYPWENRPQYPLYRRLVGPQTRSIRFAGNRTPAFQAVARHSTDYAILIPVIWRYC
jgi:hypothetical protein